MKIEMIEVDKLTPYARNTRTHSDVQIAQVVASIKEFGFTNPVLIDAAGGIIAGHARVLAARKMELTSVPCIRLGHLTEAQKRAYIIADNKLALNAGWDEELLKIEIDGLKDLGFNLDLLGFDDKELQELKKLGEDDTKDAEPQIDKAEELNKIWQVKPGDLFQIGDHRLLCGDSTKREDVEKVLGGGQS